MLFLFLYLYLLFCGGLCGSSIWLYMTRADCERLAESADDAPAAATNTQDTTPSHPRPPFLYMYTEKREIFSSLLCTVYRWMAKEKEGVGRNRRFWLGTNSGGSKRSLYDCGIVKGSREPVLVLVVRRLWSDAPFHPDDWWSHPAIHKRISLSLTIALVEWIAPSSSFPLDWFPVFGHLVSLAHPPRTYIHTYIYIYLLFYFAGWSINVDDR